MAVPTPPVTTVTTGNTFPFTATNSAMGIGTRPLGPIITLPAIIPANTAMSSDLVVPGTIRITDSSGASCTVATREETLTVEDLILLTNMSLEEAMVHEDPKLRLLAHLFHKWQS